MEKETPRMEFSEKLNREFMNHVDQNISDFLESTQMRMIGLLKESGGYNAGAYFQLKEKLKKWMDCNGNETEIVGDLQQFFVLTTLMLETELRVAAVAGMVTGAKLAKFLDLSDAENAMEFCKVNIDADSQNQ